MAVVVAASEGYSAGVDGRTVNTAYIDMQTNNLFDAAKKGALKYKALYSRENEMEADIAATRFLQYNGLNPYALASALKKMADYTEEERISGIKGRYTNEYDTHPSLMFRYKALMWLLDEGDKATAENKGKHIVYRWIDKSTYAG